MAGQPGAHHASGGHSPGDTHYTQITWNDAFELIGEQIRATTPGRTVFYTSGRTANESAFMYQLFARSIGTNNCPDCSNMCHESSGSALNPTIGIGKGTVSLGDIHQAELILVVGQNPGTNHPRMLSALKECKDNGGKIVAVNPLPEAGLFNFKDPQTPSGLLGDGTAALEAAMQRVGLTVHVSTKPNRSHVMHGNTSLIRRRSGARIPMTSIRKALRCSPWRTPCRWCARPRGA